MKAINASQIPTLLLQLALVAAILLIDLSHSDDSTEAFAASKRATSSDLSSSRHKRAPGWGKRDSVYRNDPVGDFSRWSNKIAEVSDAQGRSKALGRLNSKMLSSLADVPLKRAPGWGKRTVESGEYSCQIMQRALDEYTTEVEMLYERIVAQCGKE